MKNVEVRPSFKMYSNPNLSSLGVSRYVGRKVVFVLESCTFTVRNGDGLFVFFSAFPD